MYIGTDLIEKSGLAEKIDELDFTFSIHPDSIPYLTTYGVKINANEFTLYDVANLAIKNAIARLGDEDLSVGNIAIDGRNISADINYENKTIGVESTIFMV